MIRTMLQKLAKLGRRHIGTQPCPEIRWDEVVRILALGTDAFGAFEVSLFFFHSDGTEARLCVEHRGYDKILESLPERFPSIPPTWYDKMAETPWDVETVLYSRDEAVA
jgi:hypothetical protein